jgi:CRP/FNR family transcriptional regulator
MLLYRVGPGESCIVSIAALLGEAPCLGRADVEHAVRGALAPPKLFGELVERSPDFRAHVFATLGRRLGDVIRLLETVTTYPLTQRVAALLLSVGAPVSATHRDIADELGTVREVVSRILGDFERRGVVQLGRGRIGVVDRRTLEKIASNM